MTGRRTRWTLDVAVTLSVAFLVALSAGRVVAWLGWLIAWPSDRLSGGPSSGADPWWWLLVPAAGAMLAVLIVGIARVDSSALDTYVRGANDGGLDVRSAPARLGGLVSAVGAGVPLGADGPMMYLGGSVGAFVARRRTRWPERWLVLASATAALAMVIGAPVVAALYASEIARRGVPRRRDRTPLALGAVAAWAARRLSGDVGGVLGVDPGFTTSRVAVGAVAIGGAAALVSRVLVPIVRSAQRARPSLVMRVGVAGASLAVVAVIGWWSTDEAIFLGSGDRLRDWATGATQPALLAATLVFAALVVSMVASGVVGGLFLPLLSLGALVGVLIGRAWLPDVPYGACVGIGACCMLAATHRVPWAAAAVAFATFGWSSTAWLAVVGVVLAGTAAGDHSVSAFQVGPLASGHSVRERRARTRR